MNRRHRTTAPDERGTSTAEYAVGTLGAACIGCVVLTLSKDASWLESIFRTLGDLGAWLDLFRPDRGGIRA